MGAGYQKLISTGGAVRIPLDFGNAYAVVNPRTNAVVPLSSLNYLLMYKDSLQAMHVEWVMLQPDSAWLYGNRNGYTGRIMVRNWNGKLLKSFSYRQGIPKINRLGLANKGTATTNTDESEIMQPICLLVSTGNCPKIGVCSTTCDMCTNICEAVLRLALWH